MITNISTGTTPNVCITYPDHIATYMTGDNVVVPLDSLMDDARYGLGGSALLFDGVSREELVSEYLEEGRFADGLYAIPFMRSTEACYINADFVRALGYELPDVLSWDFIWEVSEAAAKKNADGTFALNGQKVMIPFIYKSTDNMMIQYLRQSGADYSTANGDILIFNESTRAFLREIAVHAKSGAFSTFKISSYPANFLNAGQCVFAVDSTAGSTWMGTDAPLCDIAADKIVRFETAVRPVPQLDVEHPQMISQGPSVCLFNKDDPQEVLASWLFAQFLLTDEVQTGYAMTEGYVPVTTAAQHSEAFRDYLSRSGEDNNEHYSVKLDAVELLLGNIENTFTTPVFNGSASLRDASGQMIENVTKSVRRKATVDEAFLDKLFDDMVSLYRLDSHESGENGPAELGPLPTASRALLGTLAGIWVLMGVYVLAGVLKKRRKDANAS